MVLNMRVFILCVFIFVLFYSPLNPIDAQEDMVDINSYGLYTMEMLGYEDIIFKLPSDFEKQDIFYVLMDNARQGKDDWYLIHIDYEVVISDESGEGVFLVSALSNGFSSAQIEVTTKLNEYGELIVEYNTVDLINECLEYSSDELKVAGYFTNYIQTNGIHGGKNLLTFQTEAFGDIKVDEVIITKKSGIEFTNISPPHLLLQAECLSKNIHVGDSIILSFSLTNQGILPAKNVVVSAITYDNLMLLDNKIYSFDTIEKEENVKGTFTFCAEEEGNSIIYIRASAHGGSNSPVATFDIPVTKMGQGDSSIFSLILSGFILIGIIITILLMNKNRYSRVNK
jgi:hypothetical protein